MRANLSFCIASLLIHCAANASTPAPAAPVAPAAAAYSVVALTPSPLAPGAGYALNDAGEAAGVLTVGSNHSPHAFSYTSRSGIIDLGVIAGSQSAAYSINISGQIAGSSSVSATNASPKPVLFDHGRHEFTTLGGLTGTWYGVNDSGGLAGISQIANGEQRAFVSIGGVMRNLGTLGGSDSGASALNGFGVVTGYSYVDGDEDIHAFLYDSSMHDIGTLGGAYSFGNDINDSGAVAGMSSVAHTGRQHAFYYDGAMHDLGTLGGLQSEALSINNAGEIVGDANAADGSQRAFVYTKGSMFDLNSLISGDTALPANVTLTEARAINDTGQILANGTDSSRGPLRAYLLTPLPTPVAAVPLPPAATLMLSALVAMLGMTRLRRHSTS